MPITFSKHGKHLNNRIVVNQENAASLLENIDSDSQYFIDGDIDLGTVSIEVPETGIYISGLGQDLCSLYSSENNYTMFTSPVGGSGSVFIENLSISVTGTSSKVYDISDYSGFSSLEFVRVTYNNCVNLGEINGYRQGLEFATSRFGGSPSLTFSGTWLGGYRATTTQVRSMDDTTTVPLFKAGTNFLMYSRFLTDINCDLGTLQPFCDFSVSNFPNNETILIRNARFTRDGVYDETDTNIFTNLSEGDDVFIWDGEDGLASFDNISHDEIDAHIRSKELRNPTFTYTSGLLTSISYSDNKTKSLNYSNGTLSSVVFFDGVSTTITKTFNYTDGVLTSISES